MRTALDGEVAKRDAQAAHERDGIVKALEGLLVKHAVPDSAMDVHLSVTGGTRYAGRARMKTSFGLDAVMDLDVPGGNLFERVVRVDRLMERLDVLAPEAYANGHIPGAINIPVKEIRGRAPLELPDPDQQIVVYCGGPT